MHFGGILVTLCRIVPDPPDPEVAISPGKMMKNPALPPVGPWLCHLEKSGTIGKSPAHSVSCLAQNLASRPEKFGRSRKYLANERRTWQDLEKCLRLVALVLLYSLTSECIQGCGKS
jgi:hypothetical protein